MLSFFANNGRACLFGLNGVGRGYTRWMDRDGLTDAIIAQNVQALERVGCVDIYFALAGFRKDVKSRKAVDAVAFNGYGIDIDVHDCEGETRDRRIGEELDRLLAVCTEHDLLPTVAVRTGRGLQVFWYWEEAIGPKRWRALSDAMGTLLTSWAIPYDRQVQGDRARLFRAPGTLNSKAGVRTKAQKVGTRWKIGDLEQRLGMTLESRELHPVVEKPKTPAPRVSRTYQDVADCPSNRNRLGFILKNLPSDYHTKVNEADESYRLWRNTIWAAQRTGLPNALEEVLAWARRASDKYDDLDEAVMRVWNSEDRPEGITAATLVWLGQQHGLKKLTGMHFLSAEDARRANIMSHRDAQEQAQEQTPPEIDLDELDFGLDDDDDLDFFGTESSPPVRPAAPTDDIDIDIDALDLFASGEPPGKIGGVDIDELDFGIPDDEDDIDFFGEGKTPPAPPPKSQPATRIPLSTDGLFALSSLRAVNRSREDQHDGLGSPAGPMPKGVMWDAEKRVLCSLAPARRGKDSDTGPEVVEVGYGAVEVQRREKIVNPRGESRYETVFALWNRDGTKRVNRVTIPDGELSAGDKVLARMGGAGYPSNPSLQRGGAIMSKVLRSLVNEHMARGDGNMLYEQCGWQKDRESFLLGTWLHAKGIDPRKVPVSSSIEVDCSGFGVQHGTLEGEQRVLNALTGAGSFSVQQQAYIALYLGAIVTSYMRKTMPTVYTYASATGGGKSTTAMIAEGMFGFMGSVGRRGTLMSWARTSAPALDRILSGRGTLSVTADEFTISRRQTSSQDAERLRGIIMATGNVGDGRKCEINGTLRPALPGWGGNLFITSNVPINYVLPDRGASPEAAYARTLAHPWENPPPEYLRGGGASALLDGETVEAFSAKNHGFIGPMFIQWILDHPETAEAGYNKTFREVSQSSAARGKAATRRFIDPLIAGAVYAVKWLAYHGIVKTWDLAQVIAYLDEMPATTEGYIERLTMNSEEQTLMKLFETLAPYAITEVDFWKTLRDISPQVAQGGVKMVTEGDHIYIRDEAIRETLLETGQDQGRFEAFLRKNGAVKLSRKYNFTKKISAAAKQEVLAWQLPKAMGASVEEPEIIPVAPPSTVVDLAKARAGATRKKGGT